MDELACRFSSPSFKMIHRLFLSITASLGAIQKPPQQFEYVALARAYFDNRGAQVGQPVVVNEDDDEREPEHIGQTPSKMPSVGDLVSIGSTEYKLVSVLGKGTDSYVYRGIEFREGTTPIPIIGQASNGVAIKFQMYTDNSRKYSVETDYAVLSQTSSSALFPKVFFLSSLGSITIGIEQKHLRFLVMELLGGSILTLLRNYNYRLPMETVASIGIQAVDILEALHGLRLIHGDIHLENVLFKVESGEEMIEVSGEIISSRILFGDYGKSVYYIDPQSGQHVDDELIEFSSERNMLYLSPYELAFGSPSRREDIFRLMETLARMVDQEAYGNYFRPLVSNREAILNAKQTVALGEILRGVHPVFSGLYDYSRSLGFADRPDYDRMRRGFTELLLGQGLVYTGKIILPSRR